MAKTLERINSAPGSLGTSTGISEPSPPGPKGRWGPIAGKLLEGFAGRDLWVLPWVLVSF